MATGHYARIVSGSEGPELHTAVDDAKDQSYMLYHLDRERLRRVLRVLGLEAQQFRVWHFRKYFSKTSGDIFSGNTF